MAHPISPATNSCKDGKAEYHQLGCDGTNTLRHTDAERNADRQANKGVDGRTDQQEGTAGMYADTPG